MMKVSKVVMAALLLGGVVAGLSGCKKEGPAERLGKDIDRSAENVGKEMEKVGETMKDLFKDVKK